MTRALTALFACASLLALAPRQTVAQVAQTKNPHGDLKEPCASCHVANAWKPARVTSAFKHAPKSFPLDGAHQTANCRACHETLTFKGASTKCVSCHKDFHRGELGSDCAVCHSPRSFVDRSVMVQAHQTTRFPLTGAHVTADCLSCHPPVAQGHMSFVGRPVECFACHIAAYNATTAPNHKTAGFPTQCEACHNTVDWNATSVGANFDHNLTQFPLTGAHVSVACDACHKGGVFKGLSVQCVSCHQTEFTTTTNPAHGPAGFPTDCTLCHGTAAWTGAVFDHSKTNFPLTGAHVTTLCTDCHVNNVFKGTSMLCSTCHIDKFNASTDPKHSSASFATTCADCHSTVNFTTSTWKHPTNLFQFTGAHVGLDCQQCHNSNGVNNIFKGLGTTCVTCHLSNYNATTTPAHAASGYSTQCESCHNTAAWTGAVFDHSKTLFPLTGAHLTTATCADCHVTLGNNVYKGLNTTCVFCHQTNFNNTTDPKHTAAGFATTCQTCHGTVNFTTTVPAWVHPTNLFQFTGAHVGLDCLQCHSDQVYKGKGTTCITCHLVDYNGTTSPVHSTAGYSTSCQDCHTTTVWTGAVFDHSKTLFPLTGAHLTIATCNDCHVTLGKGVYKGLNTTCVFCHQTNFNATTDPKHSSAAFATTCADCHSTVNFTTSTWKHPTNLFQFTGAHTTALDCLACHADQVYKGKGTTCVTCHLTNYNATIDPPHTLAGFNNTCQTCHSTVNFTTSTWVHPTNLFQFTGAHVGLDCLSCHKNKTPSPMYVGLGTTCVTCHLADYNGTTAPVHSTAGYGTGCQDCHTTTVWTGAVFDHSKTLFPLTGAHQTIATCNDCHVTLGKGVYKGLNTTCVFCHQTNFNATTDPKHSAAGFATTCQNCHGTVNFTTTVPVWVHPTNLFQFTGAHTTALDCLACHADQVYKGKGTTCVTCHLTNYNATIDPPHTLAGFNNTCQTCHSTVNFTTSTWVHPTNLFQFTGAHIGLDCLSCHKNKTPSPMYVGLGTTCVTCHLANYNATTSPVHSAAGYGTDCATCHTTTTWAGAVFDHSKTLFPLTGAHLTIATCNDCHVTLGKGVYKGLNMTCVFCHQTNFNATTDPKHSSAAFATTCADCHGTVNFTTSTWKHPTNLFQFTGAHVGLDCLQCHADQVYKGKGTTCVTCHLTNYNATIDPPHSLAAFNTTCQTCHGTTVFTTSTWVHPTTLFQFTGAHIGLDCLACHKNKTPTPIYVGLGTTCVTCHIIDYNNTTNPVHTTAGFSTDCKPCHTTTTWAGATFNHTWFNSKHHNSTCAQCHPTTYDVFSCRGCHGNTHNKGYTDLQCYSCHSKG